MRAASFLQHGGKLLGDGNDGVFTSTEQDHDPYGHNIFSELTTTTKKTRTSNPSTTRASQHCNLLHLTKNTGRRLSTSFSGTSRSRVDVNVDIPRTGIGILPEPPAAAAMQWAKYAREAFDQVRSSTAAVKRAASEAAKYAAVAKQASAMANNQQMMKDQAAAAVVAETLGYTGEPVGVPTANVFGEVPPSAPPYSFNYPNPPPPSSMM
ncbi:unnamed protein product [Amoebophrya sp. A120]|nr:unnamed protein product [Amoebophrya sp. A120]|eukprot:GSA120T00020682001.1